MDLVQFAMQVRMARAGLAWKVADLATKAEIGLESVVKAEKAHQTLRISRWKKLQAALEDAGVEFGDDGTVCIHDKNQKPSGVELAPSLPIGLKKTWAK